eukprot:TRINITY_DN13501_c0_g2_i1.p1 TRINITY_DN13501_c0_g2~~TRINITY_DN13501_c0_g2_i1.p1  ORF type:complete len:498 (+),score=63.62 TRINITY_DN13501_c0_g2_i1:2000-3493(+)
MSNQCILCGKCLEVCPLLNATGREELGPRAKSDLCRVLAENPGRLSEADAARLAGLCLGCGRCREVCPQGMDVPLLVAGLRAAHPDFKSWLWKTWLIRARQLWAPGSRAAKLLPKSFRSEKLGPMLKMLAGLSGGPGLAPFLTPESFPETYRGERMLLFAGCTAYYVQGRWLLTALRLLGGLGIEVLPGEFACCGSGLKGAGFADESQSMARKNVAVWRDAGRPKIAVFCASCLAGLAAYEGCFESGQEQDSWGQSLFPLSVAVRSATFRISDNLSEKLAYHRPCHAAKGDPDGVFLRAALGDRLIAVTDRQCCGFGGVMRLAAPGLTEPVNQKCWEALAGADVVLSGCSACLAQLSATAADGVEVGHWLEIIGQQGRKDNGETIFPELCSKCQPWICSWNALSEWPPFYGRLCLCYSAKRRENRLSPYCRVDFPVSDFIMHYSVCGRASGRQRFLGESIHAQTAFWYKKRPIPQEDQTRHRADQCARTGDGSPDGR